LDQSAKRNDKAKYKNRLSVVD